MGVGRASCQQAAGEKTQMKLTSCTPLGLCLRTDEWQCWHGCARRTETGRTTARWRVMPGRPVPGPDEQPLLPARTPLALLGGLETPPNSRGSCTHLGSIVIHVDSDTHFVTGHFHGGRTCVCPHTETAGRAGRGGEHGERRKAWEAGHSCMVLREQSPPPSVLRAWPSTPNCPQPPQQRA